MEFYKNAAENYLKDNKDFGNITSELGSGYNGVAFLTDKGFVVKVTKDEQEYKTTSKIFKTINGKFTPTYYKVDNVDGLYVIVMDRVKPLNLTYNENQQLNMFRDRILDMVDSGKDISKLKESISKMEDNKMKTVFSGLIDCVIGLHKAGITNADIQEDNIGTLNNKIVLFDVVEEEPQLAESIRKIIRGIVEKLIF